MMQPDKDRIKSLVYRLSNLIDEHPVRNDSFSGGRMGIAYCKFYIGKYFGDERKTEDGIQLIQEVLSNINTDESTINDSTFLNGLSGVLSVINLLKINNLVDFDMDEFLVFDELMYKYAVGQVNQNNFDFFYGSMGAFSYLVDRMSDRNIKVYADEIADLLCEKLLTSSYPYAIINKMYNSLDKRAENEINFGLPHGMGSIIINLLKYISNLPENVNVQRTVKNVFDCLIKLNKDHASNVHYLKFIDTYDFETHKLLYQGRLGWCGGDLNALHYLYYGAKVLGHLEWKDFANTAAAEIVERQSTQETLNYDPFLCHGYLGVAQYYRVLFGLSDNDIFTEASNIFLNKGIDFLEGVENSYFFSSQYTRYSHLHSFLYGAPGAILSLISAYDPSSQGWSKIILL